MKQKVFTLLTLALFFCSGAWAGEVTADYFRLDGSVLRAINTVTGTNVDVLQFSTSAASFTVGSNQLKVLKNSSATVTVSVAGAKTITGIQLTWKDKPNNMSTNVGTLNSNATEWTGSATAVTFTNAEGSDRQIKSITVTYSGDYLESLTSTIMTITARTGYASSSIYALAYTTNNSAYGLGLKAYCNSSLQISNNNTISLYSPKALKNVVIKNSSGTALSMTANTGSVDAQNKWTAANVSTTSVTFTNTSGGSFTPQTVEIEFASTDPTITVDPTSADPFTYVVGNGPSAAQTFTATLSNQTSDDITVSLQSGSSYYEISDDGSTYGTSNLTIGTGNAVYVRLKSGLSKDTYDGTLRFANEGADNVDIALSGSVTNQTYSVTYNLNGAPGDAPTEAAKEKDEVFALAAAPTRDCYTFDGWLCNIDGNTYAAGYNYTMTAAPTTFTAQWTANYASGTTDFTTGVTVGTSPSKTITTTYAEYSAFRVDNLFFSAVSKLAYDNGSSDIKFNGWKFQTNGATVKFMVENNSCVFVTLGANNGCNITYTPIGSTETTEALSSTDNTTTKKNVKAGTIVTLTTTSGSTVCLKEIRINDAEAISTASGKTYATYVTTNNLDFAAVSDEIKAYVAASEAAAGNITFTGKDEVPASTPILVKTASAGATVYVPVIASATAVGTNYLVAGPGVENPITYDESANHFYYILTNGEFKQANNSPVATTKAYLSLPSKVSANELTINFDDEAGDVTGIATVSSKKLSNGEYYNLNGQRVDASHKGIVIVNGKKYLNK